VGSLSSDVHHSASSSSLRSPRHGVVVRAEPPRRTARGGRWSDRQGDARPESSRGTGWSPEQSPMEIERERERRGLEQVRRCGGERDKDIV
jgi:hypothetical protein